jgi:cutinase
LRIPILIDAGVNMGKAVPPNPAHIASGCAALEVLVARGTSEVNYEAKGGKFGIVVGDPLISNLTLVLPGARGYPVQVTYYPLSCTVTW